MKKHFLFGLMAIALAGFGLGGVSLAACEAPSIACIENQGYASLRAAIEASKANDVITLLDNDEVSFDGSNLMLTIGTGITIEGNGKYIKGVSSGYDGWHVTVIRGDNNITIRDLTFKNFGDDLGHDTNGTTTPIYVHSTYGGKLTLENVNIESYNSRGIVIGNGSFEIKGGQIKGSSNQAYQQAIESYVSANSSISGLVITGVKDLIDGDDVTDAYGIMHAGNGTVTVTNTKIGGSRCVAVSSPTSAWASALSYNKSNGKLILGEGNEFEGSTSVIAVVPMGDPVEQSSSSTIEVNDGKYDGAIEKSTDASVSEAKIEISGGKFSVDPSSYVVAGKYAKSISEGNLKYEVVTRPTSGGGGGGGSTTYSCKNLPNNAVANNSKTPSSNTNYSYSTDTSKVCTFQCKTGYAWDADKKVCNKADTGTVADTGSVAETGTNEELGDTEESTIDPELTDIENQDWYDNGDQKEVLANGFTREMNNAYEFAFRAGITTMESIEEANMEGSLTRIAMAKMLSQYAINVLGKKPDTDKKCEFGDVSAELDAQYNNGVTLACQLGIMGVGITNFRPNDDVVRAEFGTALSRLLFGLSDGTDAYYTTHLAKLKAEGIIQNDDPTLEELRGYVMLMLMRSAK